MNNDLFDIDSILEEFSSYSADLSSQEKTRDEPEETAETAAPQSAPPESTAPAAPAALRYDGPQSVTVSEAAPVYEHVPTERPRTDGSSVPPRRERRAEEPVRRRAAAPREEAVTKEEDEPRRFAPKLPALLSRVRAPKKPSAEPDGYEAEEEDESDDEYAAPEGVMPAKLRIGGARHIVAIVFAVIAVLSLY